MVPVVFVVTLGGGNAYAALPVNITVFGQASLIVLHRPKPLKKQYFFACSGRLVLSSHLKIEKFSKLHRIILKILLVKHPMFIADSERVC